MVPVISRTRILNPDLFDLRQSTAPPNRQNGTLQTERPARCHQATCPQCPLVLWQKDRPLRGNRDSSVQFSSVAQSCPTLCDPMNRSMPGLPVHYQLPEFTQTHVHRVSDAIQPSHPQLSPSPPALNPSQHQSFPMSQLFASGGERAGVSALASFLPKKSQG